MTDITLQDLSNKLDMLKKEYEDDGKIVGVGFQKFTSTASVLSYTLPFNPNYNTDIEVYIIPASSLSDDCTVTLNVVAEQAQDPVVMYLNTTIPKVRLSGMKTGSAVFTNSSGAIPAVTFYCLYVQYKGKKLNHVLLG